MTAQERARRIVADLDRKGDGEVFVTASLLEDRVAKAIREALDEVDTLATLKVRQGQNDLLSPEDIAYIILSVKGT